MGENCFDINSTDNICRYIERLLNWMKFSDAQVRVFVSHCCKTLPPHRLKLLPPLNIKNPAFHLSAVKYGAKT